MDERPVQCEFFVPIVRNSDKQPHQPTAWNLLGNEIRRAFPAGHSGPETFYRGDALVPGEYEDSPGDPPITDTSRRYLLAILPSRVEELRQLLRRAANTFDQKAIYLSVRGDVEFITASETDGFLG
ncbi:MAG: hypothetical protein FJ271_19455 [Planctomycetes bacterium]|nr:hypothetical protein [Planctomycetota bacterium]